MSPRKGKKGLGRRATPSALGPGAESEVMTLREVAQYLDCHQVTIYKLITSFQLPGFRLGFDWRFLRSDVDKWIKAGAGQPSGSAPAKPDGAQRGRKPKS